MILVYFSSLHNYHTSHIVSFMRHVDYVQTMTTHGQNVVLIVLINIERVDVVNQNWSFDWRGMFRTCQCHEIYVRLCM